MNTIYKKLETDRIDFNVIKEAAKILKNGGLVAFPTETVYGLGANGFDEDACRKIYEAKGRPSDNPLILHISSIDELDEIVREITPAAKKIMDKFWPGPVTLILPKSDKVPPVVTGGLETVAVRFPSNKIAQAIIKEAGLPIAAPSANLSGKPSPTLAEHVLKDLDGRIDMIIDGGACDFGLESSIFDVSEDFPVILRPGAVTEEMLLELFDKVELDKGILEKSNSNEPPKAPGMKYKHYSPLADVILVKGKKEKVIEKIIELGREAEKKGLTVGVMTTAESKDTYPFKNVFSLGEENNPIDIGSNLFKTLRKFDDLKVDVVYSEVFDEKNQGMAVMNRLYKAAGFNIINVNN